MNLDFVDRVELDGDRGAVAVIRDGTRLSVSRSQRDRLWRALQRDALLA